MIDRLSLAFDPLIETGILLPLLVAALAGLVVLALVRAPGVGWRGLAVAVLALVLLNPSVVQESRQPVKDVVLVVADRSSSLDLGRRRAQVDAAVRHAGLRLTDHQLALLLESAPHAIAMASRLRRDVPWEREPAAVFRADPFIVPR